MHAYTKMYTYTYTRAHTYTFVYNHTHPHAPTRTHMACCIIMCALQLKSTCTTCNLPLQDSMPKGLTLGKIAIILATGATVLYILMITIEHLEPKHTKMRPNNL